MKSIYKRITAMLLVLIMCISMVPASVFADEIEISNENIDGGSVTKLNTGMIQTLAIGEQGKLRVLYYSLPDDQTIQTQTMGSLCGVPAHSIILSDGRTQAAAYCLNHERGATNLNGYTWEEIGSDSRSDVIGTIMAYGFQYSGQPADPSDAPWGRGNDNDKWLVTQLLVWATCNGHIFMQANHLIGIEAAVDADIQKVAPYAYNKTNFLAYYNQLKEKITKSRLIPSFASYPAENGLAAPAAKTITMKWDGEKFTATVTDTNGVLSNYNFRNAVSGVTISASGNSMTLTTDKPITSPVTSSTVTYRAQGGRGAVAVWRTNTHDPSQQDFAVYTSGYDPVNAVITVKTEGEITGNASLIKTSEDGNVSGITFTISGSDGKTYTKTTDANGKIDISDMPIYTSDMKVITYTVTEQTSDLYVPVSSQTFTLDNDDATVRFENKLKRGDLEITKTAEDGLVEGVKFHLYGTALNGEKVDEYATTNAKGIAKFEDVLISGDEPYTVEEMDTADWYVVPASQTTPIEWNKVTSRSFNNELKRGTLEIIKSAEDNFVSGLQFHLFGTSLSGQSVDLYTKTDSTGKAYFRNILIGNYTIEETGTPNRYEVPASQSAPIEWDKVTSKEFQNTLKRGDLEITKTAEDGLVEGVRFHLFGTSLSGTAIDAYAVTNAKGVAKFENILISGDEPYTVEEVETGARYIVPAAQNTPIEWNKVLKLSFENKLKRGDLEITKTAEDGLVEGIKFHLYGTAQSGEKIDEYATTNAKGIAKFENILISGSTPYTVEEVNTPNKYIVPASQTTTIKWNEVAKLSFTNKLKRGDLEIVKNAEDGLVSGLKFRLYGTSLSGESVNLTATTDSTGRAYFRDVLIGNYTIEEIGTPNRYEVPASQSAPIEWDKVTSKEFQNVLKRGSLEVTKTSEDGLVEGMRFHLYGTALNGDTVDEYATTDAKGIAKFENILISGEQPYTIEEVDTPARYVVPKSQTTPIEWKTVTKRSFENVLKRGDLEIIKNSEDGLVEGVKFHLYGTALNGDAIDAFATTNAQGVARFEDILISGDEPYTVEEVDTAIRYVIPAAQKAPIEWERVTTRTFVNVLKKFRVTVTKTDAETGDPQGDGKLGGATYGIYKGGELVDTYTTDAHGEFTTKYYVCGDDWTIREIDPSEGYLLDTTGHPVGAEAKLYTVELNDTKNSVVEQVKKGNIAIIKHTDNGDTQIETPEAGAKFEVFLKAAGSYKNAKESERDILVCDEFGFAQTKNLPYGVYIVHQTSGWDGRELMRDFEVYISENGKTYRYIINNRDFESYIKIVKKDAETGKVIPAAGVGFQIFRPDGSKVEMSFAYPKPTTIDTFYTNDEGYLVTPEKLEYGKGYWLKEVQAPYGYVLSPDPIYFDVVQEDSETEDGLTVIVVERSNMPQKGLIKISKSGEIFSSVMENEGVYQPVYEDAYLKDATYEISAAEDIYTLDGTLRYEAGEVVATITTGEDGTAVSGPLYLGVYNVKETAAPFGMALDTEVHTVELAYAGQEVEITDTSAALYDQRQKVAVSLEKLLEQDERFGIGDNGEINSVTFGLYAAEELTAADGEIIPADGLIEIVSVKEDGYVVCATDLPFGSFYLKELTTDSHYVLSDEKFEFTFEYAGQDTALVEIKANDGKAVVNELIRNTIKGFKFDRETKDPIEGAKFGLFYSDETEFNEDYAILTTESDAAGVFTFEDVPFGHWIVAEIAPAEGYQMTDEIHHVYVKNDEVVINIRIANDKLPEIGTTATVDGAKDFYASGEKTISDVVAYQHLTIGRHYLLIGVAMDKNTGKPLLIDGKEVRVIHPFVPETTSGEVVMEFTFDVGFITEDTDIVIFEELLEGGEKLAEHADITDEGQTVTAHVPEIGTTATVNGEKEVFATDVFVLQDVVRFANLIPGLEHLLEGIVMDKTTGEQLVINDKPVTAQLSFTPDETSGEVVVEFTIDARYIKADTQLVVAETLMLVRDDENEVIAVHDDLSNEAQTITVRVPEIGTTATVGGEKEATAKGEITIDDVVAYKNLTPGLEYVLRGWLMDKSTNKPFMVDGKEVYSEITFIPETSEGEIIMSFTFDASAITEETELVVFEQVLRDGVDIASHTDISSESQSVRLTPVQPEPTPAPGEPEPEKPQTGDDFDYGFWVSLGAIMLGGILGVAYYYLRKRKETPEDK